MGRSNIKTPRSLRRDPLHDLQTSGSGFFDLPQSQQQGALSNPLELARQGTAQTPFALCHRISTVVVFDGYVEKVDKEVAQLLYSC